MQRVIQILLIMTLCVYVVCGELRAQEFMAEVTFEGFRPDSMTVGQQWSLADTRDGKTYRIKYLPGGHYWMVDDLRYGGQPDSCKGKTSFAGCLENQHPGAGYWYNWMVAMQQPEPNDTAEVLTCAGIKGDGNRCRGICPSGWHIPTKDEYDLLNAGLHEMTGCTHDDCWNKGSQWQGIAGGAVAPNNEVMERGETGLYWSSTTYGGNSAAYLLITKGLVKTTRDYMIQPLGLSVRCMRNY